MDTSFLPATPGCYIFRDSEGDFLYVGKSKNLRSRVRSYFNKSDDPKVRKLAKLIAGIEYRQAANEIEALYLEHSLIKTYRPPFNLQMKKDFHPHYICIDWARAKPGLYISDKPGPGATSYGSFSSAYDARDALTVISRAWQAPSCEAPHFDNPSTGRSCLNMHIGRCMGPCRQDPQGYRDKLTQAAAFMQGRNKQALSSLNKDMNQAVQAMDFEKAAKLRDVLSGLKYLGKRFAYRVPFQGKRICVIVKGYNEPGLMLLYYKNSQLRHKLRLECPEDWHGKRDGFILGLVGKAEAGGCEYLYTSTATGEIRARKIYVDLTKTSKANLPKRLDKAINRFINKK